MLGVEGVVFLVFTTPFWALAFEWNPRTQDSMCGDDRFIQSEFFALTVVNAVPTVTDRVPRRLEEIHSSCVTDE